MSFRKRITCEPISNTSPSVSACGARMYSQLPFDEPRSRTWSALSFHVSTACSGEMARHRIVRHLSATADDLPRSRGISRSTRRLRQHDSRGPSTPIGVMPRGCLVPLARRVSTLQRVTAAAQTRIIAHAGPTEPQRPDALRRLRFHPNGAELKGATMARVQCGRCRPQPRACRRAVVAIRDIVDERPTRGEYPCPRRPTPVWLVRRAHAPTAWAEIGFKSMSLCDELAQRAPDSSRGKSVGTEAFEKRACEIAQTPY